MQQCPYCKKDIWGSVNYERHTCADKPAKKTSVKKLERQAAIERKNKLREERAKQQYDAWEERFRALQIKAKLASNGGIRKPKSGKIGLLLLNCRSLLADTRKDALKRLVLDARGLAAKVDGDIDLVMLTETKLKWSENKLNSPNSNSGQDEAESSGRKPIIMDDLYQLYSSSESGKGGVTTLIRKDDKQKGKGPYLKRTLFKSKDTILATQMRVAGVEVITVTTYIDPNSTSQEAFDVIR